MASPPTPVLGVDALRDLLGAAVLLDARSGPSAATEYAHAHLRGAHHADLDRDLAGPAGAPERGGRHPLPDAAAFAAKVASWGVRPGVPVVVYDAQGGGNAAARAWWMLRALGHPEVSVLDGGWQAALEAGLPVTADVPPPSAAVPIASPRWRAPMADIERVEAVRRDPTFCVLDVRSAERFAGAVEPIDPIAGHIPGAVSFFWRDTLDAAGRFADVETLRARLSGVVGGIPPERCIVHCGSGVTACQTLLALEHAGLAGAALYVGSWSEWCRSGRARVP